MLRGRWPVSPAKRLAAAAPAAPAHVSTHLHEHRRRAVAAGPQRSAAPPLPATAGARARRHQGTCTPATGPELLGSCLHRSDVGLNHQQFKQAPSPWKRWVCRHSLSGEAAVLPPHPPTGVAVVWRWCGGPLSHGGSHHWSNSRSLRGAPVKTPSDEVRWCRREATNASY